MNALSDIEAGRHFAAASRLSETVEQRDRAHVFGIVVASFMAGREAERLGCTREVIDAISAGRAEMEPA